MNCLVLPEVLFAIELQLLIMQFNICNVYWVCHGTAMDATRAKYSF
jgi:hypothetical protein